MLFASYLLLTSCRHRQKTFCVNNNKQNKQNFLGLKSAVFISIVLDGIRRGDINSSLPTFSGLFFFYELVLVRQAL